MAPPALGQAVRAASSNSLLEGLLAVKLKIIRSCCQGHHHQSQSESCYSILPVDLLGRFWEVLLVVVIGISGVFCVNVVLALAVQEASQATSSLLFMFMLCLFSQNGQW